jgi:hypothetical protein
MNGEVGDRIIVESERSSQHARAGVIEEVVSSDPPRYLVRWQDGHTSTFAPTGGGSAHREGDCR